MAFVSVVSVVSVLPVALTGAPAAADVIDRARATVGSEASLDALVTLRLVGSLEPADPSVPAATLLILARKPCSQRLEIRVDDMVETTILDGKEGCIVRSNLIEDASQMRPLTEEELSRVRYTTKQFFSFYRPDFKNGEKVAFETTTTHRGERVHKLRYVHPEGMETVRYFSTDEDVLVATVSDGGVESVQRGQQIVSGIKYPERIDYYESGKKLHSVVVRGVDVNQPLPAGIFEIPSGGEK